jgi:hypothetical protein
VVQGYADDGIQKIGFFCPQVSNRGSDHLAESHHSGLVEEILRPETIMDCIGGSGCGVERGMVDVPKSHIIHVDRIENRPSRQMHKLGLSVLLRDSDS